MKRFTRLAPVLGLIGLLFTTGCALEQAAPVAQTQTAASIYTQAAETIVAQITADARIVQRESTRSAQTEAARLAQAVETVAAKITTQAPTTVIPTNVPPQITPSPIIITPEATLTPVISRPMPANCHRVDFLGDFSPNIGLVYYPGEVFRKTWRLQNVGDCTWTPDYRLVMTEGEFQGGVSTPLNEYVRPGQTIDVSFVLVAPNQPGNYLGYWNLRSPSGDYFGIGPDGKTPITIQAAVVLTGAWVSYDFAVNYCGADWRTGAGNIPCQGFSDEESGLVVLMDYPVLEDGVQAGPALWTHPNNNNNGWISGSYPALLVQRGDRFRAKVGCLADSPGCDIVFQVEAELANGFVQTLGQWRETYDGRTTNINIDLSYLAGQTARFIFSLTVQNNQPGDANGLWLAPRLGP